MVRERAGLVMRSIIIPEQKLPSGVLAMIPVLGFLQPGFGPDEFHDGELDTLREHNGSFHKTDVRSALLLGQGCLHHM
jgi:hypothetical protein